MTGCKISFLRWYFIKVIENDIWNSCDISMIIIIIGDYCKIIVIDYSKQMKWILV